MTSKNDGKVECTHANLKIKNFKSLLSIRRVHNEQRKVKRTFEIAQKRRRPGQSRRSNILASTFSTWIAKLLLETKQSADELGEFKWRMAHFQSGNT